eukprot:15454605-Alexandrium_andersonii.AAC.1
MFANTVKYGLPRMQFQRRRQADTAYRLTLPKGGHMLRTWCLDNPCATRNGQRVSTVAKLQRDEDHWEGPWALAAEIIGPLLQRAVVCGNLSAARSALPSVTHDMRHMEMKCWREDVGASAGADICDILLENNAAKPCDEGSDGTMAR